MLLSGEVHAVLLIPTDAWCPRLPPSDTLVQRAAAGIVSVIRGVTFSTRCLAKIAYGPIMAPINADFAFATCPEVTFKGFCVPFVPPSRNTLPLLSVCASKSGWSRQSK